MGRARARRSRRRSAFGLTLSMGALALGIACVCLALMNIVAQAAHYADAFHSVPLGPPTTAVGQVYAEGDHIGNLKIPALNKRLPIIEGTAADELEKGVGHFVGSALPGEEDNCVLSAHRDTFFAELGRLEIGDQLIVETSTGTYTYEIAGIRIVDKDDRTVIVPTERAVLTLTTCYPFRYVGSAPDRYIVSADLVARQ